LVWSKVPEYDIPTQPAEDISKKRTGLRRRTKNILVVCGALAAIVVPLVLIEAIGRWLGSGEEEKPETQLSATVPFDLEPGLAIVEMTHQGEGDFLVDLLPVKEEDPAAAPARLEFFGDGSDGSGTRPALVLAEEKGPVNASRAVGIQTAGEHVFDVKATGPWTVRVEQPRPSGVPSPTTFSGDDDTATPLFQLSEGTKEINATNPAGGKLKVSLLDGEGNKVESLPEDESSQTEGEPPSTLSSTIDILETGVYIFDVRADSLWTLEISDAG
jgi:hypothetical protein